MDSSKLNLTEKFLWLSQPEATGYPCREILEKRGMIIVQAHNGQEAVASLANAVIPFAATLMDVQMPVMDGYAATETIRQWEAANGMNRHPIIALTADAFEQDRQHCLSVGMDDFLTKPIAIASMRAALGRWLTADAGALH